MFKNLIKHIIHDEPELPPFDCLAYEYIMASNGIFLRAENRFIKVIIPIVPAKTGTVRGLHPLAASIIPKVPLMPSLLLRRILTDAKAKRSGDTLLETLYRFHYDAPNVRVERPSQDTTATSVKTAGDGGADVILEVHSHGNMRAFWSSTDNNDEQGFRIYGVIGKLDSDTPEIRLRTTLRVANTRRNLWISLPNHTRNFIYGHLKFTFHRFGERMTLKEIVHIDHKLYQANKAYTCPNCNQKISEMVEGEKALLDEGVQVKKTCGHCGQSLVMIFDRVKPVWVKLDICDKKAESIQTCSDRWCKKEFLLQLEMPHIQFDRTEEWHVPVSCPCCFNEHWVNLYELNEN